MPGSELRPGLVRLALFVAVAAAGCDRLSAPSTPAAPKQPATTFEYEWKVASDELKFRGQESDYFLEQTVQTIPGAVRQAVRRLFDKARTLAAGESYTADEQALIGKYQLQGALPRAPVAVGLRDKRTEAVMAKLFERGSAVKSGALMSAAIRFNQFPGKVRDALHEHLCDGAALDPEYAGAGAAVGGRGGEVTRGPALPSLCASGSAGSEAFVRCCGFPVTGGKRRRALGRRSASV